MTEKPETLNFERSLQDLQAIVAKLESTELPLEEALSLYEEGQKLATACAKILEEAQLRVETVDPAKTVAADSE